MIQNTIENEGFFLSSVTNIRSLPNENLNEIDGGGIVYYNGTNVIGDFNNDGFNLNLNDIGDHDYITISFDLYIHGSWDGNTNRFPENDKADKWNIEFNHEEMPRPLT